MCDLFALSAGKTFSAPRSLPAFALGSRKNMDGWGIGYFKKNRALVEKSATKVSVPGVLHDSFQRLARVIRSRIIISHVRFRTSGPVDECHAHPFILHFTGCDWIFAHNGRAPFIESYKTSDVPLDGLVSDSARAFEYLRDHMLAYFNNSNAITSLFDVLCESTAKMIYEYPGDYNYFLSNGRILFAFTSHRQFMVLKKSKKLEGALLITTLEGGLSNENWRRIAKVGHRKGLLLAIASTDIILQRSI